MTMESSKGQEERTSILLVEDEEAHALLIKWIFEEDANGWKVDHVDSIEKARRWIADHNGQDFLVVSDYRLPDGTGLDLTSGAQRPEEMKFPFILVTGVGSEKLAVKSMKSGAMDYVVKGDDLHQLPEMARKIRQDWRQIIERRQAERDLVEYINGLEESSANPEEFMDKMAQYLERSLTYDHESNEEFIKRFRNKVLLQGRDAGGSMHSTASLDLLSKEGLDGAMMMVEMELSKDIANWEAWSAKADILYLQEKYFESLNACNKALELNSTENALGWNTKGNVLYRLDRYDQAIECYNRAIEISPLFPKSWYNKKMALEVQLKKSMKKVSVRNSSKDDGSGDSKRSRGGDGSGGKKGDGRDDGRFGGPLGDGSLRVGVGRVK